MIITVDTGGTKTLVASFNSTGHIEDSFKFATPSDETEYVRQLRQTLTDRFSDHKIEAVVVALPGIIKGGVATWCNNLGWKDFDITKQLSGLFEADTPILVQNDANLAGLSEARALEPLPALSLYVTISTGIGTGITLNGHIDPSLAHGEGGHALVEFQGEPREWESFASGKAIHDVYGQYARDITSPDSWRDIADRISRGFLAIIPTIQPDVIVFGGSIGTYFDRYQEFLQQALDEKLPHYIDCPRLVQAVHPEEAVIYGAYHYGLDYLHDHPPQS